MYHSWDLKFNGVNGSVYKVHAVSPVRVVVWQSTEREAIWRGCGTVARATMRKLLASLAVAAVVASDPNAAQCVSPEFTIKKEREAVALDSGNAVRRVAGGMSVDESPVMVDRISGLPVEVASVDTKVVGGRLVDRRTGDLIQTALPLTTSFVQGGVVGLLDFDLKSLKEIKRIGLSLQSQPEDMETFDIVSVSQRTGDAQERLLTFATASLEKIMLIQSRNGTRTVRILDADEHIQLRRSLRWEAPPNSFACDITISSRVWLARAQQKMFQTTL